MSKSQLKFGQQGIWVYFPITRWFLLRLMAQITAQSASSNTPAKSRMKRVLWNLDSSGTAIVSGWFFNRRSPRSRSDGARTAQNFKRRCTEFVIVGDQS